MVFILIFQKSFSVPIVIEITKPVIGQTPWEQISDYVFQAVDGTLYSLHPDKNLFMVNNFKNPNPNFSKNDILYFSYL